MNRDLYRCAYVVFVWNNVVLFIIVVSRIAMKMLLLFFCRLFWGGSIEFYSLHFTPSNRLMCIVSGFG